MSVKRNLFCLPGLYVGSEDTWKNWLSFLNEHFNVHVVEFPGRTFPFYFETLRGYVSYVEKLIAASKGKCSILGLSMGGLVASNIDPEGRKVVSRVLLNPAPISHFDFYGALPQFSVTTFPGVLDSPFVISSIISGFGTRPLQRGVGTVVRTEGDTFLPEAASLEYQSFGYALAEGGKWGHAAPLQSASQKLAEKVCGFLKP